MSVFALSNIFCRSYFGSKYLHGSVIIERCCSLRRIYRSRCFMCLQNTLTCIFCLSVDPFSVLDYVASSGGLIEQLERIWKEAFLACSRYYPGFCLQRVKKPAINLTGELLVTVCWVLPIRFRMSNTPPCLSFEFISDTGVEYNVRLLEHSKSFIPFGVERPCDGGQKLRPKSVFRKFIETEMTNDVDSVGINSVLKIT